MGPPIYIGGNNPIGGRNSQDKEGFNGATDLHRWKLYPIENIIVLSLGFNGATDLHRWKLKLSFNKVSNLVCFNGATDLHRWKRSYYEKDWQKIIASMGPPIYIGGNPIRLNVDYLIDAGFNGATDLHRWKLMAPCCSTAATRSFNGATDLHRWKQ